MPKTATRTTIKELCIAANIPEFISREFSWFKKHQKKIQRLSREEQWWKNHVLFLHVEDSATPHTTKKQLVERGYRQVQRPHERGTFAHTGGTLTIAPLNHPTLVRVEFAGNSIESITLLPEESTKPTTSNTEEDSSRFKPGDYVVHRDHGIGMFKGVTNELDRYWEIHYAKGDKLFVPFSQSEKLTLYLGFAKPKVRRLSSSFWKKIRKKTKYNVVAFAKKLLAHYRERAQKQGFAFAPGGEKMQKLAYSFSHPLTPDQERAWDEIANDMESPRPMDRLLAGDVGFGKTELAIRAAYKAVLSHKQVAVLAPTTILAHQHLQTFSDRLAGRNVHIGSLSRLSSKKEQKETVKKVKEGKIDIIIGTHRLLSDDIGFASLGLLIIDEEQRFGVAQKEKISMLKKNTALPGSSTKENTDRKDKEKPEEIDILMLSATPIPRTLAQSISGFKDVSQLHTPPPGRQNISTVVEPFSWEYIQKAIQKEIERGGQVFFLENRIGRISSRIDELKKHLPKLRFDVLHGRMNEEDIVTTLSHFQKQKTDVLVTTTIIENGLDLPNANTLIVADATRLGLAQAHQLRGRIGRAEKKAYAHFLHPQKNLSEKAQERLHLLNQYSRLGDGFALAMEDLKMRGAGNILGKEQAGRVNTVGLHLYIEMLNEAVSELT